MATVTRRGQSWQLNWSDASGQHRVSLGFISKGEAEIRRREKELELLTGRRYGASGVNFATFVADYLTWYKTQWPSTYGRTEGIIRLQLLPEFGLYDLDAIRVFDVTRWIIRRQASVKSATVTKEARALQAILNRAVSWGVIPSHSLATFSPPPERTSKPPEFYSVTQLQALYAASPYHRHIWSFLANTGLRRNEALFLALSDVLPDRIIVRSLEERPTKTRRWREVPINDRAQAAVEALRAASKSGYLLPRVAPSSLSRAFSVCAARASLPGSVHTLRHTFISHLVMAGVELMTVKTIAGHASITTTQRYAHLCPTHAMSSVSKIAL